MPGCSIFQNSAPGFASPSFYTEGALRAGHHVTLAFGSLFRELIDLDRRVRGPEHPDTLITMNKLANVLGYEGRHAEASKLQQETLETQRRVLGPEQRDTLITQIGLANSLGGLGKYDEAEIRRATFGTVSSGSIVPAPLTRRITWPTLRRVVDGPMKHSLTCARPWHTDYRLPKPSASQPIRT